MTQALKMSFEEYLSLEVGSLPEGQFEYVEGELRELPPESEPNDFIANYLMFVLTSSGDFAARTSDSDSKTPHHYPPNAAACADCRGCQPW